MCSKQPGCFAVHELTPVVCVATMLAQGVAGTTDVVRCFAEIVPANGLFCARVRDAGAYIGVNREVPVYTQLWSPLPHGIVTHV